jgi:hypothetical protein
MKKRIFLLAFFILSLSSCLALTTFGEGFVENSFDE